jgi:hypothetical protein
MASSKSPTGMGASGASLWKSIAGVYDLRADEKRVLEDACRESDLVDFLEAELKDAEPIVRGSQGQPVINPLISEVRQHRSTLASLLRQLRLPDETDTAERRSSQAREAANARWSRRGA